MRVFKSVIQVLLFLSSFGFWPEVAGGRITAAPGPQEEHTSQPDPAIKKIIEQSLKEHPMPGIVAAIAKRDKSIRVAAAGVRKFNDETPMTIHDQLHLGSCTKAITASMLARLVEKGEFTWDITVKQGLPEISKKIHSDYHDVTLRQLVMHLGGMPANAKNWRLQGGDNLTETRGLIVIDSLATAPKKKPGTEYVYSNLGYMIAGLIAAKKTGKPWEQLMREEVFDVLQLTTAGFGPPGTLGEVDQPWGHLPIANNKFFATQIDNAPALGPAGTVHMSIADWSRFALEHTRTEGGDFLSAESISELHVPNQKSEYAKGWIVVKRGWGKGTVLTHGGSNTVWMALIWVAPNTKSVYLAVTNVGDPQKTRVAVDGVISKLIQLDLTGR